MTDLIHPEMVYYLQGAGFRIHNELKGGHAESDYEQALVWTLQDDNVPFMQQPDYTVDYKGRQVGKYRPDLVIGDEDVLVELKAASKIEPMHIAQTISYSSVTDIDLGLIMNFGTASMEYKRLPNFTQNRSTDLEFPPTAPDGILFPVLTSQLLLALFEVRMQLGAGFLHQVYRRATRIELSLHQLGHEYITKLPLRFERHELGLREVRLIAVESKILVATVALQKVLPTHTEKLKWAMREMNYQLGVIANFHPAKFKVDFFRRG